MDRVKAPWGQTLVFESMVTNTGTAPLENVTIVDTFERGLEPTRVSDGYQIEEDQLTWKFAQIAPGQTERLQVEVICREATRACSRVTVTAAGGLMMADEACVQIAEAATPPPVASPAPVVPPPSSPPTSSSQADNAEAGDVLSLTVTDLRDEVAVGGNVVYEITVTNLQNMPDANVVVVVTEKQFRALPELRTL